MHSRRDRSLARWGLLAILGVGGVAASCANGDEGTTGGQGSPEAGASPDGPGADATSGANDSAGDDGNASAKDDAASASDGAMGADGSGLDDGGSQDATLTDAETPDTGADASDGSLPKDAGSKDAGPKDSGPDATVADAGLDAGTQDAGSGDAADAGCGTGVVVVNEVQTSGSAGLDDEWVELFNPQTCTVDISGWELRHTSATGTAIAKVFTASAGTKLGPGGYGVIAGLKYSASAPTIGSFSSGVLADSGGGLGLFDSSGALVGSMGYGAGATNTFVETAPAPAEGTSQSIARIPNGVETGNNATDFTASTPTAGAKN